MSLFWKNNGKKVRSDAENLFTDKRYSNSGNQLEGTDQISKLIANLFNSRTKK